MKKTNHDSYTRWKLIRTFSTGILMYTLKVTCVPNFISLGWFSFSSTVISCYQLLTTVDSWWQLIRKKIVWNFYVYTKVDTSAKFQLSRLIMIFINCYQPLSTVPSCWQPMTVDMKKKFTDYIHTKDYTCEKFQHFIFINC